MTSTFDLDLVTDRVNQHDNYLGQMSTRSKVIAWILGQRTEDGDTQIHTPDRELYLTTKVIDK